MFCCCTVSSGAPWRPCALDADSQRGKGGACVDSFRLTNVEESGHRCRFVPVHLWVVVCEWFSVVGADKYMTICKQFRCRNRTGGCTCQPALLRCLFHFLYLPSCAVKVLPSNYRFPLSPPCSPLSFCLSVLVLARYKFQPLLPWLPCSVLECWLHWEVLKCRRWSLEIYVVAPISVCVKAVKCVHQKAITWPQLSSFYSLQPFFI